MANKFKLKQSSVAGKVPATTDLDLGELAINTNDGKLFLKKKVGTTETIVDVTAAGLSAATSTVLGLVKGFANLTIDAAGSLSLTLSNIVAALGFTPVNKAGDTMTGNLHVGGNSVFGNNFRAGDNSGIGANYHYFSSGGNAFVRMRAEIDGPFATTFKELNFGTDGNLNWAWTANLGQVIANDGTLRFATGYGIYNSAWFGPRVGNDGICSVQFAYALGASQWNKIDSSADSFDILNSSGLMFRIKRSNSWVGMGGIEPTVMCDVNGDFRTRGAMYGNGAFWATFTSNIDANAARQAGVWGSYASSATNAPTNSGILWHGCGGGTFGSGIGDGGQLWQDYGSGAFYTRKRWGGGWGAWTYVGG